jgi:hypothetical protein
MFTWLGGQSPDLRPLRLPSFLLSHTTTFLLEWPQALANDQAAGRGAHTFWRSGFLLFDDSFLFLTF